MRKWEPCWALIQHQVLVKVDKKEVFELKGLRWVDGEFQLQKCLCFYASLRHTLFLSLSNLVIGGMEGEEKAEMSTTTKEKKRSFQTMEGVEKVEMLTTTKNKEKKRRSFKRICVFCGSRAGYKPTFSDAALDLGKQLVERKIDLVYGGGSIGLMGLVSQTVFNGGCHVLGIIPKALMPQEISGKTIGEVKIVADMHQRKSEMAKNADAFIALPGGYGTMEELLEIITWSQLGIHEKPVGLLNVDGYYNNLLALFDKGVEEGFIEDSERHIIISANTPQELINKMEEYEPVHDKVASRQVWEVDQLLESTQSGNI